MYSSPNIIRNLQPKQLRWAVHVTQMEESRNAYRVLVGKSEGKIPLRWPRIKWEDNIKIDLKVVGCDARDWMNLTGNRDQWCAYVQLSRSKHQPAGSPLT